MLGSIDDPHRVVIADFEAGLGTLLRLGPGAVDVVVVVVEPSVKSCEVAARAVAQARAGELGRVLVVANRVSGEADLDPIRARVPDCPLYPIPEDPALAAADRDGLAPLDAAPGCPAVRALEGLARAVLSAAARS